MFNGLVVTDDQFSVKNIKPSKCCAKKSATLDQPNNGFTRIHSDSVLVPGYTFSYVNENAPHMYLMGTRQQTISLYVKIIIPITVAFLSQKGVDTVHTILLLRVIAKLFTSQRARKLHFLPQEFLFFNTLYLGNLPLNYRSVCKKLFWPHY